MSILLTVIRNLYLVFLYNLWNLIFIVNIIFSVLCNYFLNSYIYSEFQSKLLVY